MSSLVDFTEPFADTCAAVPAVSAARNASYSQKTSFSSRYIVSFNDYASQSTHSASVQHLLRSASSHSFNILPRSNPAIEHFPTDFIVLETSNSHISSLLEASPSIKYVHIDRKISQTSTASMSANVRRSLLNNDNDNEPDKADFDFRTNGKLFTKWMPFEDSSTHHRRKLQSNFLITEHLGAQQIWDDGFDGEGVKVAVFDTGIDSKHAHFTHIDERTNWTDEDQLKDGIGHGSFVAGIIASKYPQCPGFAPNAQINTFRVFTNAQMSYTSWFLDSFNYAIFRKMNILNLSIGGPDWLDLPFVDKVREMQANSVIMITACGNDGKYGTINNPADQLSVIGVGGITQDKQHIAGFQSRGMTTWELPRGYGRVKPDVVTVGQSLYGSSIDGKCRTLSGTSVASPVVTGVATLLASVVPQEQRWDLLNPASLKQVLVESAETNANLRLFEQGNGAVDLKSAYQAMQSYSKHVSAVPGALDFTECPHLWPFCRQPLYYSSEPYIFNLTLLNPFSVVGYIEEAPTFEITSADSENMVRVEFEYSERLWPWCGWLAMYIYADESAKELSDTSATVTVSGRVFVDIRVTAKKESHRVSVPFTVNVIPTPPRSKRVLWDQFHSLHYPLGYLPRDDLERDSDMLDWFGDHLHTNYHSLFDSLKDAGYFVETLRRDFSCVDPELYATLIIVDPEDAFAPAELAVIHDSVLHRGLNLIVFADWYNEQLLHKSRFFDDNTRSLWDALTGGANVPAINELLAPFGIAFGDTVGAGELTLSKQHKTYFQSGNALMAAPVGAYVLRFDLQRITQLKSKNKPLEGKRTVVKDAVALAMLDTQHLHDVTEGGKVAVFGDSTCLEANQHRTECLWLMRMLLRFTNAHELHHELEAKMTRITHENRAEVFSDRYVGGMKPPQVRPRIEQMFNQISRTYGLTQLECAGEGGGDATVWHNDVREVGTEQERAEKRYQRVVEPHLYGHHEGTGLGAVGTGFLMLYPFFLMVLFMAMLYYFCRPIRSFFTWRKRKVSHHYHV